MVGYGKLTNEVDDAPLLGIVNHVMGLVVLLDGPLPPFPARALLKYKDGLVTFVATVTSCWPTQG